MTKLERAIERIMKLNRDMTKDAEFEAILREELTAAYRRGYNKGRKGAAK